MFRENKKLNIKKLTEREKKSNRDEKINKIFLNRKKKNDNKAGKKLKKESRIKNYQLNKLKIHQLK